MLTAECMVEAHMTGEHIRGVIGFAEKNGRFKRLLAYRSTLIETFEWVGRCRKDTEMLVMLHEKYIRFASATTVANATKEVASVPSATLGASDDSTAAAVAILSPVTQ